MSKHMPKEEKEASLLDALSSVTRVVVILWFIVLAPAPLHSEETRENNPAVGNDFSELINHLKDKDVAVRRKASARLSEMGKEAGPALPALIEALKDEDHVVSQNAVQALGKLSEAAVPALIQVLKDRNPTVRVRAVLALGQMTPISDQALLTLITALKDDNGDVRYFSSLSLAKVGPTALPILINALKDEDPKIKEGAAQALEEMGPSAQEAVPHLTRSLNDKDLKTRYRAAYALAKIDPGNPVAVPVLIQALKEPSWMIRLRAVDALGVMGKASAEAVPALSQVALHDPDDTVRARAAQALGKIGSIEKSVIPSLAQLLKDKNVLVRSDAAKALEAIGPGAKDAIPELLRAMGDEVNFVRAGAAEALANIGPEGVSALIQALQHEDVYIRQEAVLALGRIVPLPEKAIPALIEALKDGNSIVRMEASRLLQATKLPSALDAVKKYAQEENQQRRQESIKAKEKETRLYTKEEIVAPVPPDGEYKHTLTLKYMVPIPLRNRDELAVTLHTGTDRPDRLVVWQRIDDKHKILEEMEAYEGPDFSSFGEVSRFEYHKDIFLHVPLFYSGTAHFRVDTIFVVTPDNSLKKVTFEPAPAWYKSHLKKGEGIWKGEDNSFSDRELAFDFYIWNEGDTNCCPTAGHVIGTYKIVKETKFDPEKKKEVTEWKMFVESQHRYPMVQ